MAKRKNGKGGSTYGAGSVYPNPDGSWNAQIYIHGKLIRRREATRAAAETTLAALNDQKREGVDLKRGLQSLTTFADYWFREIYLQRTLAISSIKHTRDMLELHILPTIGNRPIMDVSHAECQQLLNDLRRRPKKKPLSAQTITHVHGVLVQIFDAAEAEHLVRWHPARALEIPKIVRIQKDAMPVAAMQRFLHSIEGHRNATAFHIMATLGTRLGETLGLRRIDCNADFTVIRIEQQIDYHTVTATDPKHGSKRPLPVPPRLAARLAAQWESVSPHADWAEHGLLFPSEVGTRMHPRNFERTWHGQDKVVIRKGKKEKVYYSGLRERGGLPEGTILHDFRKFVASQLEDCGVEQRTIGHILGHGAKNVTEKYILRSLPTMRRALEKLEAALWAEQEAADAGEILS